MIGLSSETAQLIFIDTLFLCIAGALGLWLRAWLKVQQRAIDSRLANLERQHETLADLGKRLQAATRAFEKNNAASRLHANDSVDVIGETKGLSVGADSSSKTVPAVPASSGAQERPNRTWGHISNVESRPQEERSFSPSDQRPEGVEAFAKARELLEKGFSNAEVAQRSGLGLAEVDVLQRMRNFSR